MVLVGTQYAKQKVKKGNNIRKTVERNGKKLTTHYDESKKKHYPPHREHSFFLFI